MINDRKELFTETVSAGSRIYFFDIKESQDGSKYLVISESQKTGSGFERGRIMIFEENFETFQQGFGKAMNFLGLEKITKAHDVNEIRKEHPRAYEKWDPEEEEALGVKYREGLSVSELAIIFQRQPGAIRSRLVKLGLS